ncbi:MULTISPECIES: hypothetical protein [Acidiphilium]|uniref:hypothetical protein n=1 Tax=Acidiphilium TaxID=522 RepID=UPI0025805211|nr:MULTISPECIES: hypothetical protein [Acidiphilium]HQT84428.1 hypothetical protein [Acidiphilium rubrum]
MYHADKTHTMIQKNEFDWLEPKEEFGDSPNQFLRNQYADTLGQLNVNNKDMPAREPFETGLLNNQVDLILLDNFMDMTAKLMIDKSSKENDHRPIFLNPHFYKNSSEIMEQFEFDDFLTAKQSAENWFRIIGWLKQQQPFAKIFFICFPYCTSLKSPERAGRARDFYIHLTKLTKNSDIHVIPPPTVIPELTAGEDWYHLHDSIYVALAGYVFFAASAGLPPIGQAYDIPDIDVCEATGGLVP